MIDALRRAKRLLLEHLRFHKEEKRPTIAMLLA